ncbi:PIN domain-containing protein [Campylobacter helveticus]|uniref:Type II toxin-antitoxin system VapC family toxin n=1 Tax=Campylobacter helveticus TaxID=28898 RepID=A0AAX2UGM2_9BACT|nr:PIN domain-containing protein [Campylobacter helveticus]ARE80258.1 PIN domain protein [Campylobacter helveticus]MCR2055687.1 PIN domain-containing protein [Campylobacter helveticus]MCR2057481.1 PIN domain-containing protein [Campylobacter helveticus]MCR2060533.1 PIN domain-containing protein [Campylobacter helveticus]MCR2062964.1 PIN domain-containing protein [Campylobacter helveticus]
MVYLIDTNIIIRFLVGDNEEHLRLSIEYFKQIESGQIQVEILSGILMEAYFVLTKFYKIDKSEVIQDLKTIICFEGVINKDKAILIEALNIIEHKNIDFVDALICAKCKLQNYKKLSFDKDLNGC